jgi:NAD+ kinase
LNGGSPRRPVERAAVVVRTRDVGPAVARLQAVAEATGVELVFEDEASGGVDLAVVLGGDGTMLRALSRYLGTDVAVIGVNFGRVGFLTSLAASELEAGLERVFAGEYRTVELPTLEATLNRRELAAVNDVVVTSGTVGRVIHLEQVVGDENLGVPACDGIICATAPGSTAYNLSNGGPVLVWGLEAMVITFVAPHTLHARPLVVGPETSVVVTNRSPDVDAFVLIDGHRVGELETGHSVTVHLGPLRSRLALLPEQTFFSRYRQVFGIQ